MTGRGNRTQSAIVTGLSSRRSGITTDCCTRGALGGLMSNVEIVTGVYEAFGRGDVPSVLAAMDPKIEWYEAEGRKRGWRAVK